MGMTRIHRFVADTPGIVATLFFWDFIMESNTNCSDEREIAPSVCTPGTSVADSGYEAPIFDSPTVRVKIQPESGTISFEHAYGNTNSESASSFMSILEKHDSSPPKQGLINAALARDTDTPAPAINAGPVTLPQSHIDQIRNKLNQIAVIQGEEPLVNPTGTETVTNDRVAPAGSKQIAHEDRLPADPPDAEIDLPPTVAIRPQLVVVRGERLDVAYPVLKGKNFIGRMADQPVDIDLESQEPVERIWTSRQHAVITYENGAIILEDLASLNGTFINRTRLYPGHAKLLQPGDIVQIGTVQLRVTVE